MSIFPNTPNYLPMIECEIIHEGSELLHGIIVLTCSTPRQLKVMQTYLYPFLKSLSIIGSVKTSQEDPPYTIVAIIKEEEHRRGKKAKDIVEIFQRVIDNTFILLSPPEMKQMKI